MDLDHMNDAEFMAWFEREYPPDENGNRTRYRDTMVMDLMRAAYRAERVVPAQASAPEVDAIAWMCPTGMDPEFTSDSLLAGYWRRKGRKVTPLYAAPVPAQGEPEATDKPAQ